MSIILKGIDIPKEGEWLEVIIKPTKEVIVDTIRYRDNALLNTEYGSAIQIPKEHGRIADVGEGERKMCGECQLKDGDCLKDSNIFCTDREIFSLAPTILDAEE